MRFFLIGYKSSGKTTLGKQLAESLNFEFLDLDVFMEEGERKGIPELYTELGNDAFRELERVYLHRAIEKEGVVISTGGGTPCYFDNLEVIKKSGKSVYIKVSDEALVERLKKAVKEGRPIVQGKSEDDLKVFVKNMRLKYENFFNNAHFVLEGDNLKVENLVNLLKGKNLIG